MNQYTIIYTKSFQTGSHSGTWVYSKHIESSKRIKDMRLAEYAKLMQDNDLDLSQVVFVFDGKLNNVGW